MDPTIGQTGSRAGHTALAFTNLIFPTISSFLVLVGHLSLLIIRTAGEDLGGSGEGHKGHSDQAAAFGTFGPISTSCLSRQK